MKGFSETLTISSLPSCKVVSVPSCLDWSLRYEKVKKKNGFQNFSSPLGASYKSYKRFMEPVLYFNQIVG